MATRILIKVGDESWPWVMEVSLLDAMVIKNETGLGVLPFHQGVFNLDPDCCQTIVWMCRRTNEPTLRRRDVDFYFGKGGFTYEDLDDRDPTSVPSKPTAQTETTEQSATNGSTPSPGTSPELTSIV